MTITTTGYAGLSTVELDVLLRTAARGASPAEHGRRQAQRVTDGLVLGLGSVAAVIATYDVALLLGGV